MRHFIAVLTLLTFIPTIMNAESLPIWSKLEISLVSGKSYENPLYAVKDFGVILRSPSGRQVEASGFWDGGTDWKVRFMPDEIGTWTWKSYCSDEENPGLNGQSGSFDCIENTSTLALYQHGAIDHPKGTYNLAHADGTPFLWIGCTAWNGAMKATDEEWETYLSHRVEHDYSVIQFCTTQWRGMERDPKGRQAFSGAGRITVNPEFFQDLDKRVDAVNEHGLLAAPVLLWALPFGAGRHLSPGYVLPIDEAVILARYIAARYNGNHVLWFLGGDGKYIRELEDRWKEIGRRVYKKGIQGPATLHPFGQSWIGKEFSTEPWYDLAGYQSSHNTNPKVVNFINNGGIANEWQNIAPMPIINLEPVYEQIFFKYDDKDVRNAVYWSLFVAPIGGVTYGANGIWPWLQTDGENIENHEHAVGTSTWRASIDFPGSHQVGYASAFLQQFDWWNFRPANDLLVVQPGADNYLDWVAVTEHLDQSTILAYVPSPGTVEIRNPLACTYATSWFDPVENRIVEGEVLMGQAVISVTPPVDRDLVLILRKQ